jgi:hypothetical protein
LISGVAAGACWLKLNVPTVISVEDMSADNSACAGQSG